PVRAGGGRRARGGAAAARPFPGSGAARRVAPDAATLRVSEDFRGLQQPLLVLHHPAAAREARQPANQVMAEAERLVKAGVQELLVISQDTSAYGLDIKYAESPWKGKPLAA